MGSFSLVLRRFLFRHATAQRVSLYDYLSSQAIETLQRVLLHLLQHEPVCRKTVDTVTDPSNNAMKPGHPWLAPPPQPRRFARRCHEYPAEWHPSSYVFHCCPLV